MGLRIKLTKSFSGASDTQLRTIAGLGLKKFGQERLLQDTPADPGDDLQGAAPRQPRGGEGQAGKRAAAAEAADA